MRRALSAALLMLLAAPASTQNLRQTASTLRERVVSAEVEVHGDGAGSQFHYVAKPSRAGGKPWRAWLRAPDAAAEINIFSVAGDRLIDRIGVAAARRGAWSARLNVGEVYVRAPTVAGLQVRLLSWVEVSVDTQTPVGVTNLDPVVNRSLPLRLKRLIPGVGRLALLKAARADGDVAALDTVYIYCTAFLLSPVHALTAGHCVDIGLEGRFPELVLGYVSSEDKGGASRHHVELVDHSEALDVAVLAVDPPADAVLALASHDAGVGTELLILQHFAADPLTISDDDDCLRLDMTFDGPLVWDNVAKKGRQVAEAAFAHGCDTTSTSSGSPVLNRATYEVVGLHQQGFTQGGAPHNRALRASLLASYLTGAGLTK